MAKSDRVVLPGVGAFADCRRGLDAVPGMIEAMIQKVPDKKKAIFNFHDPPVDSSLDTCPKLDWSKDPPEQIVGETEHHPASVDLDRHPPQRLHGRRLGSPLRLQARHQSGLDPLCVHREPGGRDGRVGHSIPAHVRRAIACRTSAWPASWRERARLAGQLPAGAVACAKAAAISVFPAFLRCTAYSTIRIAFLASKPISITNEASARPSSPAETASWRSSR